MSLCHSRLSHWAIALLVSIIPRTTLAGQGKRQKRSRTQLSDETLPEAVALWEESPQAAERVFGVIGEWDTSDITNMDHLFQNKASFNEDINQWDTRKVTSLKYTFSGCIYFNSPLHSWDVSKVESMSGIFSGASSFNQDLNGWETSSVTDMSATFKGASAFNASLQGWDTRKVLSTELMWYGATFFEDADNSLQNWDVSSVTTMKSMFSGATRFQGDLSSWDTKSVESFSNMFAYAVSFDPSTLNSWDVSRARFMDRMFYRAAQFEAELCWDTLRDDVSGVAMLCGSSGTFDPSCTNTNEPFASEDCPEAYMEMEEEYEVRESLDEYQEGAGENIVEEPRGGSGGIGSSRGDHPETTARLDENSEGPIIGDVPIEQRSDEPPNSEYTFDVDPLAGGESNIVAHPESAVKSSGADSFSRRKTSSFSLVLLSISLVSWLI